MIKKSDVGFYVWSGRLIGNKDGKITDPEWPYLQGFSFFPRSVVQDTFFCLFFKFKHPDARDNKNAFLEIFFYFGHVFFEVFNLSLQGSSLSKSSKAVF